MTKPLFLVVAVAVTGCGGGHGTAPADLAPAVPDGGIVGQHGRVIDYFNLTPLAGFTVTDGANSTTTDANGEFLLPAPMDTDLAPTVSGPSYSTLELAKIQASATDVSLGDVPIPSSAAFMSELSLTSADPSKALVQVIIVPTGNCTSVAGGTITVTSPADASVAYFSPSGFPAATQIYDTVHNRPAAVVFNVDPAATLAIALNHPTCKLAGADTMFGGAVYEGVAALQPAEPGDHNEVMVLFAE